MIKLTGNDPIRHQQIFGAVMEDKGVVAFLRVCRVVYHMSSR